ncbi:MAG: M20/M25/M40 family metallo-hydrolase [Halieaceae bacterium]|jgi:glutamate carboxypeptidase|nr:M20/M25/M40 family metallo-hydrolase [Halieaceae bacterium]
MIRRWFAIWMLVACPTAAASLTPEEQRIVDWVDAHSDEAIALLEETVNISSGTMNHDGVKAVGQVMSRELESLGLKTRWIDMPPALNRAGHLFASKPGKGPKFLMIGHLDTVFEADDGFQAFTRKGNIAQGPGVSDMKAGNVIIVYALKALAEIGTLEDLPVVVSYTGDEEKPGRPLSRARKDLIEAGEWADIALGFEGAVHADGIDYATIARRSSSSWLLEVNGKQAHSSGIFSDRVGAGAINEAARILDSFYGEVRGEYGLTFNAGTIQGGTHVEYDPQQNRGTTFGKTNVVPNKVVVHGGLRTLSVEQREGAKARMEAIVANHLPLTDATITFTDGYPPMPPTDGNRALAGALSAVNEALGRGPMEIWDPLRRGAADIAFVAPYTDALAGLGALGAGAHTPNESLELDSIGLAIKRAAILIHRLSAQQQP